MRIYEELFIVRPDAAEEEIDAFAEQLKQIVTNGGGSIEKFEKWGVRKLAYRVHRHTEGFYVLLQFKSEAGAVKEIERRLRVSDLAIKYLTVRIDEKLKRIEKRKKAREKRAKRKPPPVLMPAAAPGGPVPPAPGEPVAAVPAPGAPAPGAPAPAAPESGPKE